MRPANLLTAVADVLAGYAAAGLPEPAALPWLIVATLGLYGGGVVLNDVFDAKLDAVERPERPIPSGRADIRATAALGTFLLLFGIGAAAGAGRTSAAIAAAIALCALLYDAAGKRVPGVGPVNMGLCRGLNLLLGVSAAPARLLERWPLAFLPIAYVAAITLASAGEVRGGSRGALLGAQLLLGGVLIALPLCGEPSALRLLGQLPFVLLLAARTVPAFRRAWLEPSPERVRAAVRAGVLSLIALDAALAAGYAGPGYGILVLSLFLPAGLLARRFAVT